MIVSRDSVGRQMPHENRIPGGSMLAGTEKPFDWLTPGRPASRRELEN